MARELNIRVTSGSYNIDDLHITINSVSQNLLDEFTMTDIIESNDLYDFLKTHSEIIEMTNEDGASVSTVDPSTIAVGRYSELFRSEPTQVNTSESFQNKISANTQEIHPGIYEIEVNYLWSIDSTGKDFLSVLEFDGELMGAQACIHQQEGKESGGYSAFGTGTDQIMPYSVKLYHEVTESGEKSIRLRFKPQQSGIEAAMWDASVKISKL